MEASQERYNYAVEHAKNNPAATVSAVHTLVREKFGKGLGNARAIEAVNAGRLAAGVSTISVTTTARKTKVNRTQKKLRKAKTWQDSLNRSTRSASRELDPDGMRDDIETLIGKMFDNGYSELTIQLNQDTGAAWQLTKPNTQRGTWAPTKANDRS